MKLNTEESHGDDREHGSYGTQGTHDQMQWWARDFRGLLVKVCRACPAPVGPWDSCVEPENRSGNNSTGEPRGRAQREASSSRSK